MAKTYCMLMSSQDLRPGTRPPKPAHRAACLHLPPPLATPLRGLQK